MSKINVTLRDTQLTALPVTRRTMSALTQPSVETQENRFITSACLSLGIQAKRGSEKARNTESTEVSRLTANFKTELQD